MSGPLDGVPIIDLVVYPFTYEMRAGPYTTSKFLNQSMMKLDLWDKAYSPAELIARMDKAGIQKALIPAQAGGSWEVTYEYVQSMCEQFPGRLYPLAGIDPTDIEGGIRKLEKAVVDLGFVGAHSYPHWFGLPPDDRHYYPFYMKCVELDVPIQVQAGRAAQAGLRNVGRPEAFDNIAVAFPELLIVGIHTGDPWEREMISVSWKHEHVYIGADSRHPRTWTTDFVSFIKGAGKEKVLWGTNHPVLDFADSLAGVAALGFDEETKSALLGNNLLRIYRLIDG